MKHTEIEDSQYLTKILLRYGQTIFPIIAPEYVEQILAWHTSQLRATLERLKENSTSLYDDLEAGELVDVIPLSAIHEELSKLEEKE